MKKYIFLSILYVACVFLLFGCGKEDIALTVQKKEGENMIAKTFTNQEDVHSFYKTLQNVKWRSAVIDIAKPPTHIIHFDTHDSKSLRSDISDTDIEVWWNEEDGYAMLYIESSYKIGHLTEKEMKQFSFFFQFNTK